MTQSTLGDDDLFGEAAAEIREDVEDHLAQARAQLPSADAVWDAEADNVLGVLNGLRSALDVGEAEDHVRQAKKWYVIGERADAFDDAEDLEAAIEELEAVIEELQSTHELVSELTNTVPQLRGDLEELAADADADADADDDDA